MIRVSASVSAEYKTPYFVDNPKYVLALMTKSHNLAVLRNICEISYVMLVQSQAPELESMDITNQ